MEGAPHSPNRPRASDARLGLAGVDTPAGLRRSKIEFFRCQSCGEAIGVYEPLIAYDGNNGRITSRAAEPDLRAGAAAYFHRDCFAAREEPQRQIASGG